MKKLFTIVLTVVMGGSMMLTGCSTDNSNDQKVNEAVQGNVVELEGQQDQYGWFPHIRLTFEGDTIKEVYFDYVNESGAKKSQDEEYNSTMKEKTGVSVKEALENLRTQLIDKQNPDQIDVVAGATQTSTEFITMAQEAVKHYKNGENSANNYGDGNPTTATDDKQAPTDKPATGAEGTASGEYNPGGDATPNAPENTSASDSGTPATNE